MIRNALKIGVLSGALDAGALAQLKAATADLTEATGDGGLDGVLAEIALRVKVEIAKFAAARGEKPERAGAAGVPQG